MAIKIEINRRDLLTSGLACGAVAASGLSAGPVLAVGKPAPVLVELFTSQGCSSCPPADNFMGELVQRPGVIAVSMNVDYWNYLGWRDTLSQSVFTKRQKEYAARRGDGQVYTPQMVINGRAHAVGSHRNSVLDAIGKQAAVPDSYFVPIEMSARGNELDVIVGGGPTDRIIQASTVWVMSVQPEVTVEIGRGENSGRTVTYHNVVRQLTPAGMWKGDPVRLSLPKKQIMDGQASMCVAVLQGDNGGSVLGCASMSASS
jgi:hypothetical protein